MKDEVEEPQTEEPVHPKRKTPPLWLLILMILYIVLLLTLTEINILGPDLWAWSSFNLYMPQWAYALPGIGLLLLYLWKARRWLWLSMLCLLWVFGPIMGFVWRWTTPSVDTGKGTKIRVLTYNVKNGRVNFAAIAEDINKYQPDILLCQEANGTFRALAAPLLAGWNIQTYDQFLIATRLPMLVTQPRLINVAGWTTSTLRCELRIGNRNVSVYTTHLISPRGGLVAAIHNLRHPNQRDENHLTWNTDIRLGQAHALANLLRGETNPVVLTGDLNSPNQSLACRELFAAGMKDAFSEAGRGYGYSYGQKVRYMRYAYVRIDHILTSKEWTALDCWAGNTEGSEHRPVIADLYLPNAQ